MQTSRLAGKRVCLLGPDETTTAVVTAALAGALRTLGHPVLVVDADPAGSGPCRALGLDSAPLDVLALLADERTPDDSLDDGWSMPGSTLDIEALPRRYIDCSPDGTWLVVLGKQRTLGAAADPAAIRRFLRHLVVDGLGPEGVVLIVHGSEAVTALDAPTPLDRRVLVVPPVLTDAAWLAIAEHGRMATEAANGCVLCVEETAEADPQLLTRLALLDVPVLGRVGARTPLAGRVDAGALALVRALEGTEPSRMPTSLGEPRLPAPLELANR